MTDVVLTLKFRWICKLNQRRKYNQNSTSWKYVESTLNIRRIITKLRWINVDYTSLSQPNYVESTLIIRCSNNQITLNQCWIYVIVTTKLRRINLEYGSLSATKLRWISVEYTYKRLLNYVEFTPEYRNLRLNPDYHGWGRD